MSEQTTSNDEIHDDAFEVTQRRIVVSDDLPVMTCEIRGRRLESPPENEIAIRSNPGSKRKWPVIRRSYLVAGLGASFVLLFAVAMVTFKSCNKQPARQAGEATVQPTNVLKATAGVRSIEEDAKQVIRRISRDNRPYSFGEESLNDINARINELTRSPYVSASIRELQTRGQSVASRAAKEGLQPSLVILLGLALTKGGESGDSVKAASNALPLLASLNKTFGSSDGDSCLILIAAFHEGPGTRRSHPLLKRINKVVTNPLTERNVWYLNEQNALPDNALALVIDTIAFGVITRSPRQF